MTDRDRDLSEPGDLDAWLGQSTPAPAPSTPDVEAARRRLHRRAGILDWFQIGFLVIVPLLSVITIAVAHHADQRASGAREDTHALVGDVSSLSASVDRLTANQQDTARIAAQVAELAEAFRRIATATTPEERREAIDALNALGPPPATSDAPPSSSSSPPTTAPSSSPPSSATTTTTPAAAPPPPSSSTTSTTRRPLIPALTVPTLLGPTRRSSSPSWPSPWWPYWPALASLSLLLAVPVALTAGRDPERKPMTQPITPDKVAPSAAGRIIRTLYMVIIAIGVAIPAATAAFGFTAATSAKLVGLAGGITILVTALWNALEGAGVIGTVHASPAPAAPSAVRLDLGEVDNIARAVHASAPEVPESFAVELDEDEVEKIASAVARHVIVAAPAPTTAASRARKAAAAKKAAPRRR